MLSRFKRMSRKCKIILWHLAYILDLTVADVELKHAFLKRSSLNFAGISANYINAEAELLRTVAIQETAAIHAVQHGEE
jgi:hypothetical protein